MNTLGFYIPIQTVSEANRAGSEHWRVRDHRASEQRLITSSVMRQAMALFGDLKHRPLLVEMTRIAPGKGITDSDNLTSSMKHVRDAIAKELGVDDSDPSIVWRVKQQKSKRPKHHGVDVTIRAYRGPCHHCAGTGEATCACGTCDANGCCPDHCNPCKRTEAP